jgi:transcriptional/translational regulatory protein YebC/TACO1
MLSEYVREATGALPNPLSRDALIAKFMGQVEFSQTVSREDAEKLVELLDKLEAVDDVRKVVKLAVKRDKKT